MVMCETPTETWPVQGDYPRPAGRNHQGNFMSQLTFNAERHEYKLGDRVLPSVSEILKELHLIDDTWFNDYATDRGSKVHRMTLYYDEGNLDEASLDPELKGYLAAYHAFRQSVPIKWTCMETPMYDEMLGYAGTPDRIGMNMQGTYVVDIKTSSSVSKWWGVQLSAYQKLSGAAHKMTVRLSQDGRFRVDTWTSQRDDIAWQSALNLYHWKRR